MVRAPLIVQVCDIMSYWVVELNAALHFDREELSARRCRTTTFKKEFFVINLLKYYIHFECNTSYIFYTIFLERFTWDTLK